MKNKLKTIMATVLLLCGTAQAKTVVNYPTIPSSPYTGSEQTANVPESSDYELVMPVSGTSVGEYDVYLFLTDPTNTKWPDTDEEIGSTKWSITKSANEWTTEPSIESWTYGDPASTPVAAARFGTPAVTFSGTAKDGTIYTDVSSVAKAGTYTCKFTVAGTSNYDGLDPVVKSFEIKVATPGGGGTGGSGNVDINVTGYDGPYDGKDHQISVVITGEDASTFTVAYSDAQEGPFQSENTFKYKDVGTYTVWYSLQSINYATVTNSAVIKISQREIAPPTIASKEYNGAMQKADVAETADYTVEYNGEFKEAGTHEDAVVLALKDKTHCKWADGAEDPVLLAFTITKSASNVWLTEPSITGWQYGEAAHIPVAVPKYGIVSIRYDGMTTDGNEIKDATAVSKAGSYTAKFTVPETASYNGLQQNVAFTIERGQIDVGGGGGSGGAVLKVSNYIGAYDGNSHMPSIQIVGDESSSFAITYALTESGPYSSKSPEFVNVCDPTNVWYCISSPDYQTITNFASVTIERRSVVIASGSAKKVYDGLPLMNETVTYDGMGFVSGEGVDVFDFASIIEVGSVANDFDYKFKSGTLADNYTVTKSLGTLTITPQPVITKPIKIRCEWLSKDLNHYGIAITCDVYSNGALWAQHVLDASNHWRADVDAPLYDAGGKLIDYQLEVQDSRCVSVDVARYGIRKLQDVYLAGRVVTRQGYRVLSGMIYPVRNCTPILSEDGWQVVPDIAIDSYVATDIRNEGTLFWLSNSVLPDMSDVTYPDSAAGSKVPVPNEWLNKYANEFGDDNRTRVNATGCNGCPVWESYLLGLDPRYENSKFKLCIDIDYRGIPLISWRPDLSDAVPARIYTVFGKQNLDDAEWTEVTDENIRKFRFFKVEAEIESD